MIMYINPTTTIKIIHKKVNKYIKIKNLKCSLNSEYNKIIKKKLYLLLVNVIF